MNQKRRFSLFPRRLGICVEPLVRPVFKKSGLAGTRIIPDWPLIVGSRLAMRCMAEKISFPAGKKSGGTLSIAVENGFSTELLYMQPVILERVNTYFGYQAVSKMILSPRVLPAKREDTVQAGRRALPNVDNRSIDAMDDSELKEALKSLANTMSGA